ncbi:HNH endonuclease [Burkholderia cepacia]|nr:HNH endonuclease [Burkholderia cepacia]MCA8402998.1 HNH endonuclease [Burkholderia cepacia]
MPQKEWERIKAEFENVCVYCECASSQENRGIVPDHLVPVTQFGELVVGNTVPACQTCNDSRGDRDWRAFLRDKFPNDADGRIERIEAHLRLHPYKAPSPETALSGQEQLDYFALLADWESLLERARALHASAEDRRRLSVSGGADVTRRASVVDVVAAPLSMPVNGK